MSILFVISKHGIIAQKEVARILALEKSSLSRNLNRLLTEGLIEHTSSSQLTLTQKGLEKLERAIPHWNEAMKEIRSRLEDAGESALNTLVTQLSS